MNCYYCGQPAVTKLIGTNLSLCKSCFIKYVERKVVKTIRKHKMLKYDDIIGVAYSGGKDSTVLLYILNKIEKAFPKSKLIAITIDEGIVGYRDDALKIVKKNVAKLNIEWHLFSFKDIFGKSLDKIIQIAEQKMDRRLSACTYCGIFRRRALDFAAKRLGITKLATGHNLDDESQTLLINLLKGDVMRIGRLAPIHEHTTLFIPRIKPLREVSEREIVLYAYYNNLEYQSASCPYAMESIRTDVRLFLNSLEKRNPSLKYNLLHALDTLAPLLKGKQPSSIKTCSICGYPSSETICKSCKILSELDILSEKNVRYIKKFNYSNPYNITNN